MILTEWNTEDAVAFARNEGREEGIEIGQEKALMVRNIEIARNLLAKGSTPEFVSEITGLSLEEIAKL